MVISLMIFARNTYEIEEFALVRIFSHLYFSGSIRVEKGTSCTETKNNIFQQGKDF